MNPRIVVTMGDPAGVGPEVLARALRRLRGFSKVSFCVIGDLCILRRFGFKETSRTRLYDMGHVDLRHVTPGRASGASGRAAYRYLQEAVRMVRQGDADALVTAPVSKEVLRPIGFSWPGQTEFLAHALGARQVEMVFMSSRLRVVLVTRHVGLMAVPRMVTTSRIVSCGSIMHDFLRRRLRLARPCIAVCGLNPHAGENGLFGREEVRQIAPAVNKLNRSFRGAFCGPLPADAAFHQAWHGAYDLVMAMYHDQGLAPFKMTEFNSGVHLTVGLPVIRTSAVHGTAYDIAGKNKADEGSMLAALKLAVDLAGTGRR
jgi:4-hydroxythreonine-4-phosphate dehydrogenase